MSCAVAAVGDQLPSLQPPLAEMSTFPHFPPRLFKYTQIPHFPHQLWAFGISCVLFQLFSKDLGTDPATVALV